MKNSFGVSLYYHFYHSVIKAELKKRGFSADIPEKIAEEHKKTVKRAKDIGNSRLLSSYIMTIFYSHEPSHGAYGAGKF